MNRRLTTLMLLTLLTISPVSAQSSYGAIRNSIAQHFAQYHCNSMDLKNVRVSRSVISHDNKKIEIYLNQNFAYQLFRPETIDSIYYNLRNDLPKDVRKYTINIYSNDRRIEDLVPNFARETKDVKQLWNSTAYNGAAWVRNISKSFSIDKGLDNIHLSITPSHGYHFDSSKERRWEWQRPPLYTTREDLLSQSFVYPYLIPMLENAGAIVYSSRERDWQTECVIVDNSDDKLSFKLTSPKKRSWQKRMGFGYNPDSTKICLSGNKSTVHTINTNSGKATDNAVAMWIPNIPSDGDYAVYVTYQSYPNSVTDAKYMVFHSGGTTEFSVNQQIGGGTWVYLGTFHFKKGQSAQAMVTLDNSNSTSGMVCADAVRFGGGFSTAIRDDQPADIARYLEGAKYYAEFAGAPDSVFSKYSGADEYREDIWTRPYMTNWLSGSSIFNTSEKGLGVPIELAFALHTDAGYFYGDTLTGSLGIHTT
ncbi:MAG: xanthan lyase, partial [Bacteroidaceae bacterium]|nr:xanthan lyase [Bacteroidaceae bacterium]